MSDLEAKARDLSKSINSYWRSKIDSEDCHTLVYEKYNIEEQAWLAEILRLAKLGEALEVSIKEASGQYNQLTPLPDGRWQVMQDDTEWVFTSLFDALYQLTGT